MKGLPLSCMPIGAGGVIAGIGGDFKNRERLMELGFTKGAEVTSLHRSPSGDPVAYGVKGAVMALRKEDADNIYIKFWEEY